MNSLKKKFAAAGGLLGLLYLAANNLLPGIPDFLMGFVLGIAMVFLLASLLPDTAMVRIRDWKRKWLRCGE
ncbi:MAG: hypothetical protein HFF66_10420 [Oscillospiraceae bacterium]|jgi:hypothetical protein|nr:hypothetical protein [Oscillospiraceae bacterium]